MSDQRHLRLWPVLLAVWASFFLYAAIAAPIPGVNEPHYLCKARHYWQPDWCAKDFFLASPNAHTVFYATIGSLTTVFTFEQSAWIGRALATLVLAWGWTHALSKLFFTSWSVLWSAWIFLVFAACGNFSGEWLVGGVEGKVFAYGLLLGAMGDVLRDRWSRAAIWTGAAISFHPVVGIWGVLALIASRVVRWPSPFTAALIGNSDSRLWPYLLTAAKALLIVGLIALPGLIPVIRLLTESTTPQTRYTASYVQVYFRLAHHLDPMRFLRQAYIGYAILLFIWLNGLIWGGRSQARKDFDRMVGWAVVFACIGILIGYGPRPPAKMPYFAFRMELLKFYPFRLADVALPIAVSVSLISVLERTALFIPATRTAIVTLQRSACMLLLFVASLWRAGSLTESNRYAQEDRADWLNVCRWINEHLPTDALVQSPPNGWAFKWFAQRAEYVSFKDCPQDAQGIVEWNKRLDLLKRWYDTHYEDQLYSTEELKDLQKKTGVTHLLVDHLGPFEISPIYENNTFKVYDLTSLSD